MSWYDWIPSPGLQAINAITGGTPFGENIGDDVKKALGKLTEDPADKYRAGIIKIGDEAAGFGRQNAQNYQANQAGLNQSIDALRRQAAGQNSVSAEQLRQGLQQNLAAQRSMAASASPQNAVMAARTAANNMARQGYGLAGQQAVAGLQERNQAQQALGQLQLGQSGQNMQGALGGYNSASNNYAAALGNPGKSDLEKLAPYINSGAQLLTLLSDRRLKTDISDGDDKANKVLDALKAYNFRYKDERDGRGEQLGVMAQNVEKVLPQAVVETPKGKALDAAKLSGANTAMLAALSRRVANLEGREDGEDEPADKHPGIAAALSRRLGNAR